MPFGQRTGSSVSARLGCHSTYSEPIHGFKFSSGVSLLVNKDRAGEMKKPSLCLSSSSSELDELHVSATKQQELQPSEADS